MIRTGSRQDRAVHLSPPAGRGRIASAIRVRGSFREGGLNRLKDASHIAQHVVIPEPQDAVVALGEPSIANGVARIFRVLAPVDFNNEATFTAYEINSVRADRLFPNELVASKSTRPQAIPERRFCVGSGLSQAPCPVGLDLVSRTQADTPPHPDCPERCEASLWAIRPLPAGGERLAPRDDMNSLT